MSRDEEIDRAFEEIVSQVDFGEPAPEDTVQEPGSPEADAASEIARLAETFGRRAWSDALDTEASWEDEGHFVPPDPGPPPPMEPRRRVAWWALLGSPILIVAAALVHIVVPPWVLALLGLGFAGAVVYLVATSSRSNEDPWNGDDGAVL